MKLVEMARSAYGLLLVCGVFAKPVRKAILYKAASEILDRSGECHATAMGRTCTARVGSLCIIRSEGLSPDGKKTHPFRLSVYVAQKTLLSAQRMAGRPETEAPLVEVAERGQWMRQLILGAYGPRSNQP